MRRVAFDDGRRCSGTDTSLALCRRQDVIYRGHLGETVTEKVVNEELSKLTKRAPRTQAERAFYEWLLTWKKKLETPRYG